MKKLIIFDFDGTIIDTMAITYEIYVRLAKEEDIPFFTKEEIQDMRGISFRERLKDNHVSIFKMLRMMKKFIKIYKEYIPSIQLFPEMKALLLDLSFEDKKLAIVSSNQDAYILDICVRQGIDVFKNNIYGKASIFGKAKNLKKCMRKNKVTKEECLYIGDELRDIEACRSVGIEVAVVTWGYDNKALLETGKPDYLIEKVSELYKLIMNKSK